MEVFQISPLDMSSVGEPSRDKEQPNRSKRQIRKEQRKARAHELVQERRQFLDTNPTVGQKALHAVGWLAGTRDPETGEKIPNQEIRRNGVVILVAAGILIAGLVYETVNAIVSTEAQTFGDCADETIRNNVDDLSMTNNQLALFVVDTCADKAPQDTPGSFILADAQFRVDEARK